MNNLAPRHPAKHTINSTPGLKPLMPIVGLILLSAAALMLLPLFVDLYDDNNDWQAFATSFAITATLGVFLLRGHRRALSKALSIRQIFLLTPLSWFSVAAVSALPFFFSDYGSINAHLTNAVFESVSGITTTGSTVLSDLENAPPGILLWRALLQWMGGIGIIATAIAVLPVLGIGGMQLFRTESSDRSEKATPRIRQFAILLGGVYLALTVVATLVYWLAGMPLFDAIAHALSSISTGGFSTSDQSLGAWDTNGIQWFAALFMLSGSIPFVLYVRFIVGDSKALWDRQVKTMLAFILLITLLLTLWLLLTGQYPLEAALRHATFNVVSVLTTTGFTTTDYTLWGNAIVGLFFILTFVGGCTGSTTGGIKIFRFEVMAIMLKAHFLRLLYPNGVFPRAYGGKVLDDDIIWSVIAFLSVFFSATPSSPSR